MQKHFRADKIMKKVVLLFLLFIALLSPSIAENRALLIGIGQYAKETGWKKIHGDFDVELLKPLLEKEGFIVSTLVNSEATKQAILNSLAELRDSCKIGDKVYFHFSGHGQPVIDKNYDENDGIDEAMIPNDAWKYFTRGEYEGENHLIDDEYNLFLVEIKEKIGKEGIMFVVIDACHSRDMERGDEGDITDNDILKSARGTDDCFEFESVVYSNLLAEKPLPKSLNKGAKLVVVSACKEDERNFEYKTANNKMYGSLSYCIAQLLNDNCDFNKWETFFQEEKYRNLKIFQSSQHPSVTVYP